jgi:hypothetical protein
MPLICFFYGITIYMYFDDHNPPHFHAKYAEYEVIIDINNLGVLNGYMPPRALGMVVEWAYEHKQELLCDWELVKNLQNPNPINPLK